MTEIAIPDVECRNVSKIFGLKSEAALKDFQTGKVGRDQLMTAHQSVLAVSDVSFKVYPGEIFCVMGLSGSGKSTLLRMLNGLIRPTGGDVLIKGQSIATMDDEEIRVLRADRIGMVFQGVSLLPHLSVEENVAFPLMLRGMGLQERNEIALQKLSLVGLSNWGQHRVQQLSGGMQQRVGLARALAADPPILLMDEPFSALDPLIRRQLQGEFQKLSKDLKKTVVFITHDMDEAVRLGNRIAIMRDGRVIQSDTPARILTFPADSYVEQFIETTPRMNAIFASDIMRPLDDLSLADQKHDRARADADLCALTDLVLASDKPVVIEDANGTPIGLVDKDDILKAARG